jgi:peptidoglycan/xylan/chitin deacetylase (PgdA/CDA1 family)
LIELDAPADFSNFLRSARPSLLNDGIWYTICVMANRLKSIIARSFRYSGMMAALERLDRQPPNTLRVIAFHRLGVAERPDDHLDPDLCCASPEEFTRQILFINKRYRIIDVQWFVEAVRDGRSLPPRAVLLTFDDGYSDFAEHAWPVLRELGLPALLFVPTAYPGDQSRVFWWDAVHQMVSRTDRGDVAVEGRGPVKLDGGRARREATTEIIEHLIGLPNAQRLSCLDRLQQELAVTPHREDSMLTWDDLRRLAGEGLDIAPHTHAHPILTRLPEPEMVEEVRTSRRLIREEVGQDHPVFCYPNGRRGTFNATSCRVLEENGFIAAFTTVWGANVIGRTPAMTLHRIGVGSHLDTDQLRFQLTPCYWWLRRHVLRRQDL